MTFDYYWREIGRYHHEVIENPKLEDSFKSFAKKIWKEGDKESQNSYNKGYENGYEEARFKLEKIKL